MRSVFVGAPLPASRIRWIASRRSAWPAIELFASLPNSPQVSCSSTVNSLQHAPISRLNVSGRASKKRGISHPNFRGNVINFLEKMISASDRPYEERKIPTPPRKFKAMFHIFTQIWRDKRTEVTHICRSQDWYAFTHTGLLFTRDR